MSTIGNIVGKDVPVSMTEVSKLFLIVFQLLKSGLDRMIMSL